MLFNEMCIYFIFVFYDIFFTLRFIFRSNLCLNVMSCSLMSTTFVTKEPHESFVKIKQKKKLYTKCPII